MTYIKGDIIGYTKEDGLDFYGTVVRVEGNRVYSFWGRYTYATFLSKDEIDFHVPKEYC